MSYNDPGRSQSSSRGRGRGRGTIRLADSWPWKRRCDSGCSGAVINNIRPSALRQPRLWPRLSRTLSGQVHRPWVCFQCGVLLTTDRVFNRGNDETLVNIRRNTFIVTLFVSFRCPDIGGGGVVWRPYGRLNTGWNNIIIRIPSDLNPKWMGSFWAGGCIRGIICKTRRVRTAWSRPLRLCCISAEIGILAFVRSETNNKHRKQSVRSIRTLSERCLA